MAANDILLRLRLSGQKAVDAGLTKTAGTAEKTGSRLQRTHGRIGSSFGGMAKRAIGAGAAMAGAYASIAGAKKAVSVTTDLAKTTLSLHNNLGLSTEQASRWAAVGAARGVEGKALNQAFGTLSKTIVGAKAGTEGQVAAFRKLGITQRQLKGQSFDQTLLAVSDGLKAMGKNPDRAALSMKLLGKGWQNVAPVMRGGSSAMREQLALADKYGVTFKGKTIKSLEDLVAAQRESKFATMGLQVAFGTMLAPVLIQVLTHVNRFVAGMHSGTGAGGRFAAAATQVWTKLQPLRSMLASVGRYLIAHPGLIATLITALGGFSIVSRIVSGFRMLNFVLNANPAIRIATVIIALGTAFVTAYTSSAKFRRIVDGVFSFLKRAVGWAITPLITALDVLSGGLSSMLGVLGHVPGFGWAKDAARLIDVARRETRDFVASLRSIPPKKIVTVDLRGILPKGIVKAGKSRTLTTAEQQKMLGMPGMATGGLVRRAGAALVGERGPEVLSMPAGARVTPLTGGAGGARPGTGGARTLVTHVNVVLDRAVLAKAMATQLADDAAFS